MTIVKSLPERVIWRTLFENN